MVTILIAARNEEDSILACIQSCLNQNYPPNKLEVIVVDDQSEDDTNELLESIEDPRFVHMRLGVYKRTTIKGSKKKQSPMESIMLKVNSFLPRMRIAGRS